MSTPSPDVLKEETRLRVIEETKYKNKIKKDDIFFEEKNSILTLKYGEQKFVVTFTAKDPTKTKNRLKKELIENKIETTKIDEILNQLTQNFTRLIKTVDPDEAWLNPEKKVYDETTTRAELIDEFEQKYICYCDKEDNNLTLYVWLNNHWTNKTEALFLDELYKVSKEKRFAINKDELLDYFRGVGLNTSIEPLPLNYIPYLNGLFNIDTFKLEPFNTKYFFINQIPLEYDEKKTFDAWTCFQEDIHNPETLKFIQEWWGYNLYRSYPIKAFFMAIGGGNNGKSIEFDIISKILGYKNITTMSLQDLTYNLFSRAECYQKLAIISDDVPSNAIKSTGYLKSISSGSRINAQRKHGHPFDFTSYSKPSFALNNPPEINDDTESFWVRLKIEKYDNIFNVSPDQNKGEIQGLDKDVITKVLTDELQGINNWMLVGLKRLRDNGFKFSPTNTSDEVRTYYRKKSQPCISWIEECFIYTENELTDVVFKKELYPHFKEWCINNNIKTIPSSYKLFQTLKDLGIEDERPYDPEIKGRGAGRYFGYIIQQYAKRQPIFPFPINKTSSLFNYIKNKKENNNIVETNIENLSAVSHKTVESVLVDKPETKDIGFQEIQDRLSKVFEEKQKLMKDLGEFGKIEETKK